ncbi:hypothetical protein QBC40DRAFT_100368 [Triangularia verruculosa]|uniref:Uncharacterized protein n=1 Tax=Triangularia verruculosa TaxID=2587418 RepID=A0AAN7AUD2_9PEZI|nr:hypothetical protein QBC40DRAFT_100368 [Triangularia verruculosa]
MDALARKRLQLGVDDLAKMLRPKLTKQLFLTPPATIDVDPADFALRTKLELIGKATWCDIEAVDVGDDVTQISIFAPGSKAAQAAAKRVSRLLADEAGVKDMWRTNGLLCPPKSLISDYPSILLGRDRLAVARLPLASSTLEAHLQAEVNYKDGLSAILDRAVGALVRNPNKMKMRVKFGCLQRMSDHWKPELKPYTPAEFEQELKFATFRDLIQLTPHVPASVVEALRLALCNCDANLPKVVLNSIDSTNKPNISLHIVTPNLEVECMLEGFESGTGLKPRVMPVGAYQRDKTYNKFSVLNSCPDRGTDWELEITEEVSRKEARPRLPLTEKDMTKVTRFGQGAYPGGFPKIQVSPDFIKRNKVSNIVGKVTWIFELSIKYNLEITMYYSFGTDTTKAPTTTAIVSLFSLDWDDELGLPMTLPREWNESFATQLLTSRRKTEVPYPEKQDHTKEHPLDQFLSWVSWVQEMLETLSK